MDAHRNSIRACAGWLALCSLLTLAIAAPAQAWIHDANANRIDDRIERVDAVGLQAAYENDNPAQRLRFGVIAATPPRFPIYVGYDRRPGDADVAALAALGTPYSRPYLYIHYVRTEATYAQIQAIAALPGVVRVEAVQVMYLVNHYGTRSVRARDSRGLVKNENGVLFPSARQELGLDGTGIVIAILDTGVNDAQDTVNPDYHGHESLAGKFLGGGEFFYGDPLLNTPNEGSMNPQDHGGDASSYHATHVAGIALGSGGPGGIFAGVAPKARLVDLKVLSDAGASVGGVVDAIEWCIFNRNKLWPGLSGPDEIYRGIDVLNLSLGGIENTDGTDADAQSLNAATRHGLVVCAASGNLGTESWIASPASADSAITVGATDHKKTLNRGDDAVTFFSQEGPRADDLDADHRDEMKPNLVAPGFGIVSADGDYTTQGRGYKGLSGTSMASPSVAGCAALLLQANPTLTPMEVRAILENTADHNTPSDKGNRANDPFGIDPNYDPGCGWGLVDILAAAKEALGGASGVQVIQERAIARVADGVVDFRWVTQREFPFLGFDVYRAPDAGGAPGAFAKINSAPVAPAGDPILQGDDNRQTYVFTDNGPLTLGQAYWYRVAWLDGAGTHLEPPVPVEFGQLPRLATAYYSIRHDSPDADLSIRVGVSTARDPEDTDYSTFGPGEANQDSFAVVAGGLFYFPPGNTEHFWSIGFTAQDGIGSYLPPSPASPWFLNVAEGGFVDQSGAVNGFSLFVNDSPGSSSGTTWVTNSVTPRPTVEGNSVTLWIPETVPLVGVMASFRAEGDAAGIRLMLELMRESPGASAEVYRALSPDLDGAEKVTAEPIQLRGARFEWLDAAVEAGVTYWYWVSLRQADGTVMMNGPVSATSAGAFTALAPAAPNPLRESTTFAWVVGNDVVPGSEVSLALFDLQGRVVRTMVRERARPGQHRVAWDARDERGERVAPGTYYARFQAGSFTQMAKVTVVR